MADNNILKAWGDILSLEGELMEYTRERELRKACNKKQAELLELVKKSSKEELRAFKAELSEEISALVEEESETPLSQKKYLQTLSDVIFFFRECRSIVSTEIEHSVIVRREKLAKMVAMDSYYTF